MPPVRGQGFSLRIFPTPGVIVREKMLKVFLAFSLQPLAFGLQPSAFSLWPFSPPSPPNRAGEKCHNSRTFTLPAGAAGDLRCLPWVRAVVFRKLARNKLLPDFLDTMTCEILAGVMIFSAGNVAYFEIRRLIQFLRTHFNESKRCETTGIHPFPGTAASTVPK